ncbi:MAG: recombinase family protein [Planctomycetes bacterium]|nr:recombinase family protein [Planctomycetota bacterium]
MYGKQEPLVPRNGHKLVAGIVARISGCASQKELSLEDQVDHGKEIVAELYDGPVEFRVIATKGKGEWLDRPELVEIEAMIRSRELDLLIIEDLGRMVRGVEAVRLCGIAVDHGTRVICDHDCIDTSEESWEEDAISACRDHVGHNAHTSKRLKKKLMNRFRKFGGATAREPAGYIKPDGAKTYDDWRKDESATPLIQEGLRILKSTLNCSAVADYFNEQRFPPGKYCRGNEWDGKMVRRLYGNSILKGMPSRGSKHTVKHHETGRRVSMKNPAGPFYYDAPHLAHVSPVEFDEVNARLQETNRNRGRKPINGEDPRLHVPRKRTRCPGQHAKCWYCGRELVWGGNGMTDNLMCKGARKWRCWNSIGVPGPLAAEKLVEVVTSELYQLKGFDAQFVELVKAASQNSPSNSAQRWQLLQRNEETLARENKNLASAIAELGLRPLLRKKLQELEEREKELAGERHHLELLKHQKLQLPQSVEELRQLHEEQFQKLAIDSPEFGDLMRQLVPDFHIYLVRSFDGGHLLPRARIKLDLVGNVSDACHVPGLEDLLTRGLTLDLFRPPQRERIRDEAVHLAANGLKLHQIAAELQEKPTTTAVQNALALDRKMRELGLQSPYQIMMEPPQDYAKLRRHRNPKYRFELLEGYERPAI